MKDLYVFKYGYPKNGITPEQFEIYFEWCAEASERILTNRSVDVISNTMRDIDLIINEMMQYKIPTLEINGNSHIITSDGLGSAYGRSGISVLLSLQIENNKKPFKHMKDAHWKEIFAVYTLGLLAYANRDLLFMSNTDDLNRDDYLNEMAGYYLAEVIESNTIATFIHRDFSPVTELENEISKNNKLKENIARSGGKAKNEKYARLKKTVLEEYTIKHNEKSNKQAARDIYRSIPDIDKIAPDGNPILTEHNAIEQIARWIGSHKRNNTK